MSRWYRAYEGTVTDAKLGEVALVAGCSRSVAIAAWHCLLESASGCNAGGVFDATPRRVAVILGEQPAVIEAVFSELVSLGMIVDGKIAAWSKRQYESDNSTERSRKHRERSKTAPQQQCNSDATLQQQHATPPDTDTDTEGIILEGRAREIPDPVARETNQFTEDWNRIEAELRKAAGWENEPAPNLAIMGPVIEALRTGVDFELDLLPAARAHGQKMRSKTSWNYIIECAISARDRRRAVRSGAERGSRMGVGDGAGRGTGGGLIEKFLGGQRGGVETGNSLP